MTASGLRRLSLLSLVLSRPFTAPCRSLTLHCPPEQQHSASPGVLRDDPASFARIAGTAVLLLYERVPFPPALTPSPVRCSHLWPGRLRVSKNARAGECRETLEQGHAHQMVDCAGGLGWLGLVGRGVRQSRRVSFPGLFTGFFTGLSIVFPTPCHWPFTAVHNGPAPLRFVGSRLLYGLRILVDAEFNPQNCPVPRCTFSFLCLLLPCHCLSTTGIFIVSLPLPFHRLTTTAFSSSDHLP